MGNNFTPAWIKKGFFNESLFCDDFLSTHQLLYVNGAFFTPEGRVTDTMNLRCEIFDMLRDHIGANIAKRVTNVVDVLKLAAQVENFLPVTDRANEYCEKVAAQLEEQGFRTEVDYRNEKIGRKIRDAQTEKVPYMVIVGDRDMENGTVSPRHRADGDLGAMSVDEFSALLKRVVDNKEQK